MVQGVSGKRRFLVRFQYGFEKDLTSNQLTAVTVDNIPVDEKPEMSMISVIPDDTVDLEKGCYHGVYDIQDFMKTDGVDSK